MIEVTNRGHHRCGALVPPTTRSKHPGPTMRDPRLPEVKLTLPTKRGQRAFVCTLTRAEWLSLDSEPSRR